MTADQMEEIKRRFGVVSEELRGDSRLFAESHATIRHEIQELRTEVRDEARADIVDYIERWHNPRQRRRLDQQQQGEKLLTQLSVETG